jgi:hypothetical protein
MRLTFERFYARRSNCVSIIDQDTGQEVGFIQTAGVGLYNRGGIDVSLFDDKYTITVHRFEECWGFVMGVQTVLKHMIAMRHTEPVKSSSAA